MRWLAATVLVCFALCVNAHAQQFTVEVIQPAQPIVVIVERAKTTISTAQQGPYLVMFTAKWCVPCQAWKRNQLARLQAAGHQVTIVDIDSDPRWNVSTVPTFWVVERATRKPIRKFTGTTSADVLLPFLRQSANR
jgi:thiol:disulfide interchange protein